MLMYEQTSKERKKERHFLSIVIWSLGYKSALLYNFTSVYADIPCCRRDESKTSFPYKREYLYIHKYLYNKILFIMTHKTTTF